MGRFVKVDKDAMAQGYVEMAELNLKLAQSSITEEEEGWMLSYGVETKESGGNAQ